jgi:hypothetical protein
MKMAYEHDPMLAEIRQIRKALWEESGHDLHKMVQIIEREAREVMIKYGKTPKTLVDSNSVVLEGDSYEVNINN